MKCNLSKFLETMGISTHGLAKKIGIPYPTMRNWVKGRSIPKSYNMDVLCAVLQCTIGELYEAEPVDIRYMPVLKHEHDKKEYIRQVTMDNLRLRTRLRDVNKKELAKLPRGDE